MSRASVDELVSRYADRTATVAVIGLGYVGLPLVNALVAARFDVIGFDVDPKKIAALREGQSYIKHLPAAPYLRAIEEGHFHPTTSVADLGRADAILICVPTPLTRHREPDLTFVTSSSQTIASILRPGQLIVLESTTYPGTTRDVIKPILEQRGLECGRDFFIAYSPEREDPGNSDYSTAAIPKVVAGDGPDASRMVNALYGTFVSKTVQVPSLEVAEAVKLTENIFRSVNIALVNELKVLYAAMGIDIWEVIEAAKTKPFGFMPFYPGPGLGGHCIPIDPFYLTWKAREFDITTRFIELAGEINTSMPQYVVSRVAEELNSRAGRAINGSKILIVGIAYKKNVDDTRESPAFRLIELLEHRGAVCDVYDPYVDVIPRTREHPDLANRRSIALHPEAISAYDAIVIATDHDCIDYKPIVRSAKLVIDTRNACFRAGAFAANVVKA